MTLLPPPFQWGWFLFLLLVWLLWAELPILCWIKVVKVDISVLLVILREMLLAFPHGVRCCLCLCHTWPVLCWTLFPLFTFCWEFLSWMGAGFCQMCFLHVLKIKSYNFLKDFIYLFLEKGKEGEREGEKTSVCGCLSSALYWGPVLQPRHVPWPAI